VAVTASIACDAATVLPRDHVQELFPDSFDQGGQIGCLGATSTPEKKIPKHGKGKHNHVGKDVLFEFACAKDSSPGEVGRKSGVRVIRLCKEDINLIQFGRSSQYRAAHRSGWRTERMLHPRAHRMQALEPMATFKGDEVSKAGSKDQS